MEESMSTAPARSRGPTPTAKFKDVRTPGLKWRTSGQKKIAYWICREQFAALGYPVKTQRLWAGIEPTEADLERIRRECQRLQGEMLDWKRNPSRKGSQHWRRPGVIYFMGAGDLVKIGFTTDLKRRLTMVQVGCPTPITLIGTIPGTPVVEKNLHRLFYKHRHHGEWFRLVPEIEAYIAEHGSKTDGEQDGDRMRNAYKPTH
jgi:hypothetical protein